MIGLEVISSTSSSYECTPELTLNGATSKLSSVTFDQSITPYLDAVTPRFGSERGGERVTFTGKGFTGEPTVIIDDLLCTDVEYTLTTISCTPADKPLSKVKETHPSL